MDVNGRSVLVVMVCDVCRISPGRSRGATWSFGKVPSYYISVCLIPNNLATQQNFVPRVDLLKQLRWDVPRKWRKFLSAKGSVRAVNQYLLDLEVVA